MFLARNLHVHGISQPAMWLMTPKAMFIWEDRIFRLQSSYSLLSASQFVRPSQLKKDQKEYNELSNDNTLW